MRESVQKSKNREKLAGMFYHDMLRKVKGSLRFTPHVTLLENC